MFKAENKENQPLIDALHELSEAESHSNRENAGFRGRALRTAAQNLAKLEDKITSGHELAGGPDKVEGVGNRTAHYIDEYLETGKIKEIDQIKKEANEKEAKDDKKSSERQKRKRTEAPFKAKNKENQPLIDALYELSEVETHSNNKKAGFKGRALRRAAQNLAELRDKITNGQELAGGPKKVQGVGSGTAYYIDEFLETGRIDEIDEREANNDDADEAGEEKKQSEETGTRGGWTKKHTGGNKSDPSNKDEIHINRAPVLTLWVATVAERQGYSREEAVTYGRWISSLLAQAKGQALGVFQKRDKTKQPKTKSQRTDTDHVEVFSHIDIPVEDVDGKKIAVESSSKEPHEPEKIEDYLERAFGNQDLKRAREAMKKLADSVPKEELRDEAYEIYEVIRPEWKGWGKPGTLDLHKIRDMAERYG